MSENIKGYNDRLIFHDNETLQKEVDDTSMKLYNFILKRTV